MRCPSAALDGDVHTALTSVGVLSGGVAFAATVAWTVLVPGASVTFGQL